VSTGRNVVWGHEKCERLLQDGSNCRALYCRDVEQPSVRNVWESKNGNSVLNHLNTTLVADQSGNLLSLMQRSSFVFSVFNSASY
jgi:hypothetical protein